MAKKSEEMIEETIKAPLLKMQHFKQVQNGARTNFVPCQLANIDYISSRVIVVTELENNVPYNIKVPIRN